MRAEIARLDEWLAQLRDEGAHLVDLRGIEAVAGLVEDQYLRAMEGGLGHADPLAVSPRQGIDWQACLIGQLGSCDRLAHGMAPLAVQDAVKIRSCASVTFANSQA